MADVLTETGLIPKINFPTTSTFMLWIIIILGGLILAGGIGYGVYWFVMWRRYNKKIILYRKVGNTIMPVGIDKGMFQRVGIAGDYVLKTRRLKKTLPRPQLQMGKDLFWFYERLDGEWINFTLGDFDEKMKEAGAYYVDEDMRLQRLGIQKNLAERLQKIGFWAKYGQVIMSVVFMVLVTVCLVVLFRELTGVVAKLGDAIKAMEHLDITLANIQARSGSGVVPA